MLQKLILYKSITRSMLEHYVLKHFVVERPQIALWQIQNALWQIVHVPNLVYVLLEIYLCILFYLGAFLVVVEE